MKLVVAEKPSVAQEIAKVIGSTKKETGFYCGNDYLVSWCVGHLIQSANPEDYDPALKKWTLEALPIIPVQWKTVISERTESQFKVLQQLVEREDVTELICATDAGREGELIFRLVYEKIGTTKPFTRLWISSMETKAIQAGFSKLKPSSEYDNLYHAAKCRMCADWLVGMNMSRLYSCLYQKQLNVGRVQTPTINLIVSRQRSLEGFVAQQYFTVIADCGSFKAYAKVDTKHMSDSLVGLCNQKSACVTAIEQENKVEHPPALFDLTTLQRESNRVLGYSAQQTLDIVQALYEAKVTTYPRTDSRYLTQDMETSTIELITDIVNAKILDCNTASSYQCDAISVSQIINDKKVSDHHAIIPTKNVLIADFEKLPTEQQNILTLIIYQLIIATYAPHKYTSTQVCLNIEGESFLATGKQIIEIGFKEFQKNLSDLLKVKPDKSAEKDSEDNSNIPSLTVGFVLENVKVTSQSKKTKPPQPYTEASLLGAMENAGKQLDNQDLRAAIKDGGLGTPATRANVIERIIKTGFIVRKGRQLLATQQAYALMDLLPKKLKEAELTAEWESQLQQIHQGKITDEYFMSKITTYVSNMVSDCKVTYDPNAKNEFTEEREVIGICPRCKKNVVEFPRSFSCESGKGGCGFTIWKEDNFFKDKKKALSKKQVTELLKLGKTKVSGLYSPKTGKIYDAIVALEDTGKYINYKLEFENKHPSN